MSEENEGGWLRVRRLTTGDEELLPGLGELQVRLVSGEDDLHLG